MIPKTAHDFMAQEYVAREEGWIYVYVSNENSTLVEVYFDDVTITHTKSNLIQYNEYYPFGMQTARSWSRPNSLTNNFLANGGTELNTTSQLYDLEYRHYDQVLGRMNGVDPMTTKYASLTPYNYSFNDPVTFTDATGADPWDSGPYAGNSAYYYAMQGLDGMSPGQEAIMDPFGYGIGGGGVYWNPRTAGGYGLGVGNYIGSMSLNYENLQNIREARNQPTTKDILATAWHSTPNNHMMSYSVSGSTLIVGFKLDFSSFDVKNFHRPAYTAGPGDPVKSMAEVIKDIKSGGTVEESGAIFLGYMINPQYGPEFFIRDIEKVQVSDLPLPESVQFARKVASWGHSASTFGDTDEIRHIVGSFLLAEKHGAITARVITSANEAYGLVRFDLPMLQHRIVLDSQWAFQFQDLHYNDLGISIWGAYNSIKAFRQSQPKN